MYWLTHWFVTRVKCSVCGGQLLVGHSITAPAALCNYNGMAGNQGICAVNTRPPLTSTTTVYLQTVSNIQSKHAKLGTQWWPHILVRRYFGKNTDNLVRFRKQLKLFSAALWEILEKPGWWDWVRSATNDFFPGTRERCIWLRHHR